MNHPTTNRAEGNNLGYSVNINGIGAVENRAYYEKPT